MRMHKCKGSLQGPVAPQPPPSSSPTSQDLGHLLTCAGYVATGAKTGTTVGHVKSGSFCTASSHDVRWPFNINFRLGLSSSTTKQNKTNSWGFNLHCIKSFEQFRGEFFWKFFYLLYFMRKGGRMRETDTGTLMPCYQSFPLMIRPCVLFTKFFPTGSPKINSYFVLLFVCFWERRRPLTGSHHTVLTLPQPSCQPGSGDICTWGFLWDASFARPHPTPAPL